ncbi:MAG: hypothetical protein V1875_07785 [Candidatus Altiarchaeota archaeon]
MPGSCRNCRFKFDRYYESCPQCGTNVEYETSKDVVITLDEPGMSDLKKPKMQKIDVPVSISIGSVAVIVVAVILCVYFYTAMKLQAVILIPLVLLASAGIILYMQKKQLEKALDESDRILPTDSRLEEDIHTYSRSPDMIERLLHR